MPRYARTQWEALIRAVRGEYGNVEPYPPHYRASVRSAEETLDGVKGYGIFLKPVGNSRNKVSLVERSRIVPCSIANCGIFKFQTAFRKVRNFERFHATRSDKLYVGSVARLVFAI